MINYYQPFLYPFLGTTPNHMPKDIRRTYFLSFEDGLWVLLKNRRIPKGSVVLIPDFYCMDVVENIRAHGYTPVFYPLDDHFRITAKKLDHYIQRHTPAVTIVFHACGLTHTTGTVLRPLFSRYPDMLIIEDAVHRLIHPEQVALIHPNHYLIDSLRKVSTLPGSFLYRRYDAPPVQPDRNYGEWDYALSVLFRYLLFRLLFTWGVIVHNPSLIRDAHERILRAHDDIVGDSIGGYAGFVAVPFIHRYFNFTKIMNLKKKQVNLYMHHLDQLITGNPAWYAINIPEHMKQDLHVFPVGRRGAGLQKEFIRIQTYLHKQGIISWFKFTDCPWSRKRGVLFLPLGFHITHRDILFITKILKNI